MADVPIDDLPPKYKKPLRRKRARVNDTNDGSPHALTPTPADEASGQPKSDDKTLANYTYGPQRTFVGAILVISDLLVFSFLGALVFASPDQMSGAAAVLKNAQGEYVGVLRKCAGGACDPWMGGGGTADSSDSSAFSLPDMFLTLGLAALSALWLAIYVLLFTAFRIFTKTPDNASDKPLDGFKRYVYRATRVFLVVNVILVPSLLIDVIVKANSYRGSEGLTSVVGAGVVLIVFAFLFTLLSTLIELGAPDGRISRWILKQNCPSRFCGCCTPEAHLDEAEKGEATMRHRDKPERGKKRSRRQRPER